MFSAITVEKLDSRNIKLNRKTSTVHLANEESDDSSSYNDLNDLRTLYVVSMEKRKPEIQEDFSQFGEIEKIITLRPKPGHNRFLYYVVFTKVQYAAKALDNPPRGYCKVEIKKSFPNSSSGRSFFKGITSHGNLNRVTTMPMGMNPPIPLTKSQAKFMSSMETSQDNKTTSETIYIRCSSRIAEGNLHRLLDIAPGFEDAMFSKQNELYMEYFATYNSHANAHYAMLKLNGFEFPQGEYIYAEFKKDRLVSHVSFDRPIDNANFDRSMSYADYEKPISNFGYDRDRQIVSGLSADNFEDPRSGNSDFDKPETGGNERFALSKKHDTTGELCGSHSDGSAPSKKHDTRGKLCKSQSDGSALSKKRDGRSQLCGSQSRSALLKKYDTSGELRKSQSDGSPLSKKYDGRSHVCGSQSYGSALSKKHDTRGELRASQSDGSALSKKRDASGQLCGSKSDGSAPWKKHVARGQPHGLESDGSAPWKRREALRNQKDFEQPADQYSGLLNINLKLFDRNASKKNRLIDEPADGDCKNPFKSKNGNSRSNKSF